MKKLKCVVCSGIFKTKRYNKHTCSDECSDELDRRKNERKKDQAKQEVILRRLEKVKAVKAQGCICPGCGHDFSSSDDVGLGLIFERCHYHGRDCLKRKKDHVFYACRICNNQQAMKCGSWIKSGEFKQTCRMDIVRKSKPEIPDNPLPF
jgi:predicted nucleic acid-binding Zn ribbon protein